VVSTWRSALWAGFHRCTQGSMISASKTQSKYMTSRAAGRAISGYLAEPDRKRMRADAPEPSDGRSPVKN